jgi:hypothetical protein
LPTCHIQAEPFRAFVEVIVSGDSETAIKLASPYLTEDALPAAQLAKRNDLRSNSHRASAVQPERMLVRVRFAFESAHSAVVCCAVLGKVRLEGDDRVSNGIVEQRGGTTARIRTSRS